MSNSQDVSAGDNATAVQYNNLRTDIRLPDDTQLVNLVKNYPSLEGADGSGPDWWGIYSNSTLTEEDALGEGLHPAPNERILKVVTTAVDVGAYQNYVPANEPALQASSSVVSAGAWVYVVTAGTLTMRLYDSVTGSLGSATTTTTGGWVYLDILNKTIGANTLYFDFIHSTSATFYVANPVLNIGSTVIPWRPRGLVFKNSAGGTLLSAGSATSWTDVDATSYTSNLAVLIEMSMRQENYNDGNYYLAWMRPNGSSLSADNGTLVSCQRKLEDGFCRALQLMDDGQIFEYIHTGTHGGLSLYARGYYEWES